MIIRLNIFKSDSNGLPRYRLESNSDDSQRAMWLHCGASETVGKRAFQNTIIPLLIAHGWAYIIDDSEGKG